MKNRERVTHALATALALLACLSACGGDSATEVSTLVDDQTAAFEEMADILDQVQDVDDLEDAKPRMQELGQQMAALRDDWEAFGESLQAGGAGPGELMEFTRHATEVASAQMRLSSAMMRLAGDPELRPHINELMEEFGDAFDKR